MFKKEFIFTLLIFFMFTACATSMDWRRAKHLNTADSYQKFLIKHPKSEFEQEAIKKIQEIEWRETKKTSSFSAYSNYLKEYPDSKFEDEARRNLFELSVDHLISSLETKDVGGVSEALDAGADPNHKLDLNRTPLIYLAKDEADRVEGGFGYTSFFDGSERLDIAKLLINHGANVGAKDAYNRNALDYLLEAKTTPGKRGTMTVTVNGKTVEHKMKSNSKLIELLKKFGGGK